MKVLFHRNGNQICEDEFGKHYIINEKNLAVVMLARHFESFIFIKQFRRAINDYAIQLPGGGVEDGEELEDAVRREFLEETGYQCGNVQYLGQVIPASWINNVITHVFYTDDIISLSDQRLEAHESIEVIKMDVKDTIRMIKESQIDDSELCFAILQGMIKGIIEV